MLTVNISIVVIWILHEHLLECKHVLTLLFVVLHSVHKDTFAIKFANRHGIIG